ncbi:hypothetical protein PanWU01x14_165110 [Parasponia andersonii]|uniref:Uncharacterized protein n=1 Tax=Parasponia andersonii TaxID=3476 RepID=A0A2P5CC64_PARAD|nr:hypothetical protein PanWU01x14_165110 [Parasponia andersonii]
MNLICLIDPRLAAKGRNFSTTASH